LNTLSAILAQASQQTAPAQSRPWFVDFLSNPLMLMVLVLVVLWIFMLRGKRNEERKRQGMINALKRGDRVQTIGGILGTVVEARDNEVLVKVDESSNTKIRFARSAIHRVVEEEKPLPK